MTDEIYDDSLMLMPVMNIELAKARLKEFREFMKEYLVEGINDDYGTIEGTQKPTLFKPGADKLCEVYGLADTYTILDKIIDFNSGLFDYEIQCTLVSRRNGNLVATGLGSCSSFEGKYRWRDGKRTCPQCGVAAIFASKNQPGFYCWKKKDGCGAQFGEDDPAIINQPIGKIENDDFATLKNTILKMAKKRAKVDATLSATRSSGIFSQDIGDDDDEHGRKTATAKPRNGGGAPQGPTRKSEKLDPEAEAYMVALQGRQWVADAKRGWLIHTVKAYFLAGGKGDILENILHEAAGVTSPDLLKDEQAPAAVAAIENATKLLAAKKPAE